MNEIMTIGEFAKLKDITTETLRHYDRVGLLKPIKVDKKNGYRYYSILQYEKLATIIELRQLGMNIEQIKEYFNGRNIKQSLEILKNSHALLKNKIEQLELLEINTMKKINHLSRFLQPVEKDKIQIKYIEERKYIYLQKPISNDEDLTYCCAELENKLNEIAPIVASNRYGLFINKIYYNRNYNWKDFTVIIFVDNINLKYSNMVGTIGRNLFACMLCSGDIDYNKDKILYMENYIKSNGYEVIGNIIEIIQVDISVTDIRDELLYEIQIPIKKS